MNNQMKIDVNKIIDVIQANGNIGPLGRNKRRKLETKLKKQLMASGGVPTTSAMALVKTELEENFELPDAINLGPGAVVLFNEIPVNLGPSNYGGFDENLLNSPFLWHMIVVHHRRVSKSDILEKILRVVGDDIFTPFGYQTCGEVDFFLINNQGKALKRIIEAGLVVLTKSQEIKLTVKLGVAKFVDGHPKISDMIFNAIEERMNSAMLHGGRDVLDLTQFSQHEMFRRVELRLSNKATLNLLADLLNGIERLKKEFRVLKFANNGIRTLESFTKLYGFQITLLDLRHNHISSESEFYFLKHLQIEEIYLAGNGCVKSPDHREKIFNIVSSLNIIDGQARVAAPVSLSATLEALKNSKRGNGSGNNPILKIDEGIQLNPSVRKNEELIRLQNSFPSHKREVDGLWTQVTIFHLNYTFEQILDELMPNVLNNSHFFPCYFKKMGNKYEFFLCKNFEALRNIFGLFLQYPMPPKGEKISFTLKLKAAPFMNGQVDWFHKINLVLSKRFNDNFLNLNGFTSDPEFSHLTVPMNSKANLSFILEQARKQNSNITKIDLQNNGITTLEGLQVLSSDQFSKVTILDLRNNRISSLEGTCLTSSVKELLLDGNPICQKHSSPSEYVSEVLQYFQLLDYIDGRKIEKMMKTVTLHNFLATRDAYAFADEFIRTFFTVYDSEHRRRVLETYDSNAILTISCHFSTQVGSNLPNDVPTRVQRYSCFSRSINKIANMNHVYNTVYCGLGKIDNVLGELPKSQHLFNTFVIDVPIYEPQNRILITVHGTFEDSGVHLNELSFLFAFTRTFILQPTARDPSVFKVTNDQLSIHCPTPAQRDESIYGKKTVAREGFVEKNCKDLLPTEMEEKELKLMLFRELSQLKMEKCRKFMEENFWDMKVALVCFSTLLESGKISDGDFDFK